MLTTFLVDESGDAVGQPGTTLREAVAAANANPGADEIEIADGVVVDLVADAITISESVDIRGLGSQAELIANPFSGSPFNNLLTISQADPADPVVDVTLSNLAFFGGRTGFTGGAVWFRSNGTLTVEDSRFEGSFARAAGGAIAVSQGDFPALTGNLVVERSVFLENATEGRGGAIAFESQGDLTIRDSTIGEFDRGNTALASDTSGPGQGGGVFAGGDGTGLLGGTLTIENTLVQDNTASQNGGGIYAAMDTVTLTGIDVALNESGARGGGIYALQSDVVATDLRLFRNTAASFGGGFGTLGGTLTGTGWEVRGNAADLQAGGLVVFGEPAVPATVTLSDALFVNNTGTQGMGGVYIAEHVGGSMTDVRFIGNAGGNLAGGYYLGRTSAMTLTRPRFQGNDATGPNGRGGGVYSRGNLTIDTGTFLDNVATGDGGGVYIIDSGEAAADTTITATGFFGNIADDGGAFAATGAAIPSILLDDVTAFGNRAVGEGRGAAVAALDGADITVVGGQYRGNIASADGGGFYSEAALDLSGGTVVARNTTIFGNGGGIAIVGGSLTADAAGIRRNTAVGDGGGISVERGDLTLTATAVVRNEGLRGGGVAIDQSTGGSVADINGGAINLNEARTNVGTGKGGGLFANNATLSVTQTSFFSNAADEFGGGLRIEGGSATVVGAYLSENVALGAFGGGLSISNGTHSLSGVTLFKNRSGRGGGAHVRNATVTATDTIYRLNDATTPAFGRGGGLELIGTATYDSTGDAFRSNAATEGGGLYADTGTVATLTDAIFNNNTPDATAGPGTITLF